MTLYRVDERIVTRLLTWYGIIQSDWHLWCLSQVYWKVWQCLVLLLHQMQTCIIKPCVFHPQIYKRGPRPRIPPHVMAHQPRPRIPPHVMAHQPCHGTQIGGLRVFADHTCKNKCQTNAPMFFACHAVFIFTLKGCWMGRSDKVSLWYVSLWINTRFRFFILE